MITLALILVLIAVVCFVLAACNVSSPVNLTALGLVFLTLWLAFGK